MPVQRREILAALNPVEPSVVMHWTTEGQADADSEEQRKQARGGVMGAGVSLFGVDNELGMSGE